jgi:hypothetical protein
MMPSPPNSTPVADQPLVMPEHRTTNRLAPPQTPDKLCENSSSKTDGAVGPWRGQPTPAEWELGAAPQLELLSPPPRSPLPSPSGLLEVHSKLSQILFALGNSQQGFLQSVDSDGGGEGEGGGNAQNGDAEKTFSLVSSLCDIIICLLNSPLKWSPTESESSPCLLLAASVTSTVVEIYQKRVDALRHASNHEREASSTTDPQIPLISTHRYLQMLLDATVMEFHLTQLHKALGTTGLGFCGLQMLRQIEQVCASIQIFVGELRKSFVDISWGRQC